MPNDDLPLKPPIEKPRPTPAPPWVALLAAWLGLLTLLCTLILLFLPGSRNPRAELEHIASYSPADRFLPIPVYASVLALFVGATVFWQMRREPRPLPRGMLAQRVQAMVGIVLALISIAIFYAYAALRATGRGL